MAISAQTIVELRQDRLARYHAVHPDIMRAIRPDILRFIPLASMSRKYLNELLQCEACYRLSEHLDYHGKSRSARNVRGLAESSLFALTSVDSYRGALQDILMFGRLPLGWKVPQLPHPKIILPYRLKREYIGQEISKLEGLQINSRLEVIKRRIWSAKKRRAGVYSYDIFVPLS